MVLVFALRPQAEGGVSILMATSTSPAAMSQALPTLAKNGTLIILGAAADPIHVDPGLMISGRRKVLGFPSGTSTDSEDTMKVHQCTRSACYSSFRGAAADSIHVDPGLMVL